MYGCIHAHTHTHTQVLAQFESWADLMQSIEGIYMRLDEDGSGGIGLKEMQNGLPKIIADIELSHEDFFHIASDIFEHRKAAGKMSAAAEGSLEDESLEKIELDEDDFKAMCVHELKSYLLRESNKALAGGENPSDSMLLILKWVMVSLENGDKENAHAAPHEAAGATARAAAAVGEGAREGEGGEGGRACPPGRENGSDAARENASVAVLGRGSSPAPLLASPSGRRDACDPEPMAPGGAYAEGVIKAEASVQARLEALEMGMLGLRTDLESQIRGLDRQASQTSDLLTRVCAALARISPEPSAEARGLTGDTPPAQHRAETPPTPAKVEIVQDVTGAVTALGGDASLVGASPP